MVEAAVADVVSPSVATEYPNGFFHEILFQFKEFLCQGVLALFQQGNDLRTGYL